MGAWSLRDSGILLQIAVVPRFPSWHVVSMPSLSRGSLCARADHWGEQGEEWGFAATGSWAHCWSVQQQQRHKISYLQWQSLGVQLFCLGQVQDFAGKCGDGCSTVTSREPSILRGKQGIHPWAGAVEYGCQFWTMWALREPAIWAIFTVCVLGNSSTGKWDKPLKISVFSVVRTLSHWLA